MNRFFLLLVVLITSMALTSCSDNDDSSDGGAIVLSADKQTIMAGGQEYVTLTVKDDKGADVTNSCKFTVNEAQYEGRIFTAMTGGAYKVQAIRGSSVSNVLTIGVVGENSEFAIKADKEMVILDGVDFARLKLVDEYGNDLTKQSVFYANGTKLEGSVFQPTTKGSYKISASWKDKTIDGLTLGADVDASFTDRVLLEEITGTNCTYCYLNILELDPLIDENPQVVLIATHTRGYMLREGEGKTDAEALVKYIIGSPATPTTKMDRVAFWDPIGNGGTGAPGILSRIKAEGILGIAIQNKIEGDVAKVTATISSRKSFKGKICVVLVENGVMADQMNLGMIEMKQAMRNYLPSVNGDNINVVAKQLTKYNIDIPLTKDYIRENCRVVVFVVDDKGTVENAQQTALGMDIGY